MHRLYFIQKQVDETYNMTFETRLNQKDILIADSPFSPRGRFGRLSYIAWLFITSMLYSCALFIVVGVAAVAMLSTGAGFDPSTLMMTSLGMFTLVLFALTVIVFTVASICICVRRLHDLNKSGWWWLLFLIPIVNIFFGIYILVAKGTAGPNNYGPQRPTEQTEKLLGIFYSIILALFIIAYGAIAVWAISMQGQMPYSQIESYEHQVTEYSSHKDHESSSVDQTEESIETEPKASSTVQ